MKRRSKTKFTQIHVSIPVRVLEDLDDTLDFKQSRSKVITKLVMNYLEGDQIYIGSMLKKEIVVALMNQTDPDSSEYVLLTSLLQVFSKQS
jgi:metal-responsive CopG/Arc/MetJ family transcriptional regulator